MKLHIFDCKTEQKGFNLSVVTISEKDVKSGEF